MIKNQNKAGTIAGISLIIMAIAAGFSYGYVQNELVTDSAEITKQNIIENQLLFLAGLAGWIVIFITDLIVAIALYRFFKATSKVFSLLTAIVRIAYTLVLGVAIYQLLSIIPVFTESVNYIDVLSKFSAFEKIWSAGLIVFGFHLAGLGYLSLKSETVPRFLGYLLYFAGVSYTLIHIARQTEVFNQDLISSTELALSIPMAMSEILLAIWLIYNGLKAK